MYNNNQLRLFCEIGLVKHLADMVQCYDKNSRFGGFLKRLEDECAKLQTRLLPLGTQGDMNAAGIKLDRFGYEMDWVNRKKSPNFMFCFNMRLLEESRFLRKHNTKLIKIMADLLNMQEERGLINEAHHEEGDKAYSVWLSIWGEADEERRDAKETALTIAKIDADRERRENFERYRNTMYGK